MSKIYVHNRGIVDKSSHDNGKFALYGALPRQKTMILLTTGDNLGEIKLAKEEWADAFKAEGIILKASQNKGETMPMEVKVAA
jgi:hypothetical protein